MEIPTSCYCCSFSVEKYEGSGVYDCVVTDNCVCKGAERNVDCPLVPVPEHDGPLVDALDIINAFPDGFIFTNEQARALTNYIIPANKEGE